jgi:hypothetical protein
VVTCTYDGMSHPVISYYTRVNARTLNNSRTKAEKAVQTQTVVLSPDWKTATETVAGINANGQQVNNHCRLRQAPVAERPLHHCAQRRAETTERDAGKPGPLSFFCSGNLADVLCERCPFASLPGGVNDISVTEPNDK